MQTHQHKYKSKIDKLDPCNSKYQINEILSLIFRLGKLRCELYKELNNDVSYSHHK